MRLSGELAQLARASALQAEGQGFEPPILHFENKRARLQGGSRRRAGSSTERGKGTGIPLRKGAWRGRGSVAAGSLTERRA